MSLGYAEIAKYSFALSVTLKNTKGIAIRRK
jgi:hypothetical protein